MRNLFPVLLSFILFTPPAVRGTEEIHAKIAEHPKTFCNPVNLNYRFMKIKGGDGIREAADPVVIPFKDKYFLFASKSGGYWHTQDFVHWTYVSIPDSVLPIEDYAPGCFVYNDELYYVGSTHGKGMLYRSRHPEKGEWEKVKAIDAYWDPAFLVEGNRLYMYHGCSPQAPIHAQALELPSLEAKSKLTACLNSDMQKHGWERPGEHNELPRRPYVEGAWMTKHKGKYYLQYAAPGTEWKTYADGVYVSESPMGPFRYMENSPVSYKPAGFMSGAGHGCLFQTGRNYWKAATNAISVRHMFERRVSFYPAGFDEQGFLYTNTYLGDYPMYLPTAEGDNTTDGPGWMLLSHNKPVTASTSLPGHPAENAVDEESRTSWAVAGNGDNEWLQIDLQDNKTIQAIQVNYDEYGAKQKGTGNGLYQSYVIHASRDGKQWFPVADKSGKRTDDPHDYIEFEQPFQARYIKWTNSGYTISPNVSLRDLRIFGKANCPLPGPVENISVERDIKDPCKALLKWKKSTGAEGYVIRFGISPDKLYHSHQILEGEQLELTSLNADSAFYFVVDAYNGQGITRGKKVVHTQN